MNLYTLTESYRNLLELTENEEVQQEVLEESLKDLEDDINTKVENIAKVIKTLNAESKVLDEEVKRLANRKKILNNRIDSLKTYVLGNMNALGLKKVKGAILSVSITEPKSTQIYSENLIPNEYKEEIITFKIDKTAIKKAINEGLEVPGAKLITNESITIR